MNDARLIDYYATLNLPPTADLVGVENAYARLSHELVSRTAVDDTALSALKLVNEAYATLSRPDKRLDYDSQFFKAEIERQRLAVEAMARRGRLMADVIVAALAVVLALQVAGLAYLGREQLESLFGWV